MFYYRLFEWTHFLQHRDGSGVVKVALTSYPRPKGISNSRYGVEAYTNEKSLAKEDSRWSKVPGYMTGYVNETPWQKLIVDDPNYLAIRMLTLMNLLDERWQ